MKQSPTLMNYNYPLIIDRRKNLEMPIIERIEILSAHTNVAQLADRCPIIHPRNQTIKPN